MGKGQGSCDNRGAMNIFAGMDLSAKPEGAIDLARPDEPCVQCGQQFASQDAFHITATGPIHGWGTADDTETCLRATDKFRMRRPLGADSLTRPSVPCLECGETFKDNAAFHDTPHGPIHGWGDQTVYGTCELGKSLSTKETRPAGIKRPTGLCIECGLPFDDDEAFHYTIQGPLHGWAPFNTRNTCEFAILDDDNPLKPDNAQQLERPTSECLECGAGFNPTDPFHPVVEDGFIHGWGADGQWGTCPIKKDKDDADLQDTYVPKKPDNAKDLERPKVNCIECGYTFVSNDAFHYTAQGPVHGWDDEIVEGMTGTCSIAQARSAKMEEAALPPYKPKRPENANKLKRPKGNCVECGQSFLQNDAFHQTTKGPIHGWDDAAISGRTGTCTLKKTKSSTVKCLECKEVIYQNEPYHAVDGGAIHGYGTKKDTGTCLTRHRRQVSTVLEEVGQRFLNGEITPEEIMKLRDQVRGIEEKMSKHVEDAKERSAKEKKKGGWKSWGSKGQSSPSSSQMSLPLSENTPSTNEPTPTTDPATSGYSEISQDLDHDDLEGVYVGDLGDIAHQAASWDDPDADNDMYDETVDAALAAEHTMAPTPVDPQIQGEWESLVDQFERQTKDEADNSSLPSTALETEDDGEENGWEIGPEGLQNTGDDDE